MATIKYYVLQALELPEEGRIAYPNSVVELDLPEDKIAKLVAGNVIMPHDAAATRKPTDSAQATPPRASKTAK
jgi:hypothetical protein